MRSPAFSDPQIDLLARGERRAHLASALAKVGLRPVMAPATLDVRTSIPLLIDLNSVTADPPPPGLMPVLTQQARPIVCLGAGQIDLSHRPDAIRLLQDTQIANLPARLALRQRALLRENERLLRAETAREFGSPVYTSPPSCQPGPSRMLFIGAVSARLLAMTRGLAARKIELVSCMTLQTAATHLNQTRFRLVLVEADMADAQADGLTCLSAHHANTPFLLAGDTGSGLVFDGLVDIETDMETGLDLLAERARAEPLSTRLERVRLSATSHDPLTGLYSEAFLRAHLPRQMAASAHDETCLTLLSLKLRTSQMTESRPGDLSLLAQKVVASVRETDLVARLGQRGLLCVLRDTSYAGAVQLAERLVTSLEDGNAERIGLTQRLMWRVVERRGSHTPDGLIATALTGPFSKPLAA